MKRCALCLLVLALAVSSVSLGAPKKKPCKPTLSACPKRGCAEAGKPEAFLNMQKRKGPTGTLRTLTFDDFQTLQDAAETLFDGHYHTLAKADRVRLANLTAGGAPASEGDLVEIVGFIAVKPTKTKPHANTSGESVNCRLTKAENNDFHISITPSPDISEFLGIVVEMVPQQRPDEWTEARLKDVQGERAMVRVRGQLFFDNHHRVNADENNNIGNQPKRMSLWEIHPITEFHVCTKQQCTAGGTGWETLANWSKP